VVGRLAWCGWAAAHALYCFIGGADIPFHMPPRRARSGYNARSLERHRRDLVESYHTLTPQGYMASYADP